MTKPSRMLALPLMLSACVVGNPYSGDTFDSATTTDGSGMTETGTSGSMGDGDGDPATGDGDGDPTTTTTTGDGDGDPTTTTTTGDGDGDPTTTTTGDGDGDPTTGDGDGDPTTTGDGDGDPPPPACERRRWRYDFGNDSWSSVALDSVWAGNNAPPCDVEISGATFLEATDQLLVWTADGTYYRKKSGNWSAPQQTANAFPQVGNKEIESVYHVPPINGQQEQVLINSLPNAYLYYVSSNGTVTHFDTVQIEDVPPPGPAQAESVRTWALSFGDPDLLGNASWWGSWQRFDDNRVYRVDGAFEWENWGQNSSPMFNNNDSPNPATIEAAWGTYSPNRGYLIGF